MKKILLASVALTAFAGAAAAEVSFSGDAELGYNDTVDTDSTAAGDQTGVYYSVGLVVSASVEMDNGLTATAALDVDIATDNGGAFADANVSTSDYVLTLSGENASLTFGDVETAAVNNWSGVTNMDADDFDEKGDNAEEANLRGDMTFGAVSASVSYALMDASASTDGDNTLEGLSFAATADLGQASVQVAFQDKDNAQGEILGLAVSTTVAGADVKLAYADNKDDNATSTGIQVAYATGPVTTTVFYVSEDATGAEDNYGIKFNYAEGAFSGQAYYYTDTAQAADEYSIAGSYDMGNGLVMTAGMIDGDSLADDDFATFVVAEYDLGGGASLLASFADGKEAGVGSSDIDTFGGYELNDGTTLELSFAF